MDSRNQTSMEWWITRIVFIRCGLDARNDRLVQLLLELVRHFETEDSLTVSQAQDMIRSWLVRNKRHIERKSGCHLDFEDNLVIELAAHYARGENPPKGLIHEMMIADGVLSSDDAPSRKLVN